jgi:hypothetical protein
MSKLPKLAQLNANNGQLTNDNTLASCDKAVLSIYSTL